MVTMTPYDVEQVVAIAKTVFEYESRDIQKRGIVLRNYTHVYAAQVLATGEPCNELTWTLNVKLGAEPYILKNFHQSSERPLIEFAAAFAEDPPVQARFLHRLKKEAVSYGNSSYASSYGYGGMAKPYVVPPPTSPDLRLDEISTRWFHPLHSAWYTHRALVKVGNEAMTYQSHGAGKFLGQIAATLTRSKEDSEVLREIATTLSKRELAKKAKPSTDYHSLAEAIRLADQEVIEKVLRDKPGVQQALLLALRNPSEDSMVRGLRSIAGSKHLSILRFMGRSPTLEELVQGNVKGAAEVWRMMPWSRLSDVVESRGEELRAALIKRSEVGLDELRQCLADHPHRYTLEEEVNEKRADDLENSEGDFQMLKRSLMRFYDAQVVCDVLNEILPPEVVQLVALRHLTDREDLAKYVDHLLPEQVLYALAGYDSPLSKHDVDSSAWTEKKTA